MKAVWYERNGEARDVLTVGEMPTPEPGSGEVRVKLRSSGVNPSDVKSRRGRPLAGPRVIPHSDGAGVIDAVGEGLPASRTGERVWTWNGQWKRPFGTAAEFITLPTNQAVRLPDGIDFAAGACLGIPALTAMHAVRLLGPVTGKTVLVTGAASAVGHYAVQIAVARGAGVIGTASAERGDRGEGERTDRRQGCGRHHRHGSFNDRKALAGRRARAAWEAGLLWIECARRYPSLVSGHALGQPDAAGLCRLRIAAR